MASVRNDTGRYYQLPLFVLIPACFVAKVTSSPYIVTEYKFVQLENTASFYTMSCK